MQCMVTITHNDHVPELLAVIRRKPFAEPTETEMVEYLFTQVRTDRRKADFENFAFVRTFGGDLIRTGGGDLIRTFGGDLIRTCGDAG